MKRRYLTVILPTLLLLFMSTPIWAHEITYDKKLYQYTSSSNIYSKMDIYLKTSGSDRLWWDVPHAHQKFYFANSTVTQSTLLYFKIWDQDRDLIFTYTDPYNHTTDYDNSINTSESVYNGDNQFRMRVQNKDIYINDIGVIESYYWYEDTVWENR